MQLTRKERRRLKADKLARKAAMYAGAVGRKSPPSFYESREWRHVRYQALVRSDGRCQCCGASSKDGATLHVDHIKPRSKYRRLELELSNLQVLCADCNLGKSNVDETDWRQEYTASAIGSHLRLVVNG